MAASCGQQGGGCAVSWQLPRAASDGGRAAGAGSTHQMGKSVIVSSNIIAY